MCGESILVLERFRKDQKGAFSLPVHAATEVFSVELVHKVGMPAATQAIYYKNKVACGPFEVVDMWQWLHRGSCCMSHDALVHLSHILKQQRVIQQTLPNPEPRRSLACGTEVKGCQ
jgi:hypothetical protein